MGAKKRFLLARAVFLLMLVCPLSASEKISFQTSDGFQIQGEWFKPGPSGLSIVLLHGLASTRDEWRPFAELLSANGIGVLIYDQRGHGESLQKLSGESVSFQLFFGRGLHSDWGKMVDDLGEAVLCLKAQKKIPAARIAVGGASIGANIALRYAASHKEVPFALLLSPGVDYQGIRTDDAVAVYGGRPLLVAVSSGDEYAYKSTALLKEKAAGARFAALVAPPEGGHGVQMFRRDASGKVSPMEERILLWIKERR